MNDYPIRSVYVIINPASGQDQPILGTMNRAFHAAGLEWDVGITKREGDALRMARDAAASGVDAVAVYGGDGTVMEVANGLRGSDVPLAIFPGGTANVMSVELGIPGDLEQAVALVSSAARQIRTIDMGRVRSQSVRPSDQLFLLRLSIGYLARMTEGAKRDSKQRMGVLAYALSALKALPQAETVRFVITVDGEQIEVDGVTCIVGNAGSLGVQGLTLSRTMDVADGLLDVVVLQNADLFEVAKVIGNSVGGVENLPHWQGREIRVRADPQQPIECDGEMIDPTPVTVSIVPQALRVIVPDSATVKEVEQALKSQQ